MRPLRSRRARPLHLTPAEKRARFQATVARMCAGGWHYGVLSTAVESAGVIVRTCQSCGQQWTIPIPHRHFDCRSYLVPVFTERDAAFDQAARESIRKAILGQWLLDPARGNGQSSPADQGIEAAEVPSAFERMHRALFEAMGGSLIEYDEAMPCRCVTGDDGKVRAVIDEHTCDTCQVLDGSEAQPKQVPKPEHTWHQQMDAKASARLLKQQIMDWYKAGLTLASTVSERVIELEGFEPCGDLANLWQVTAAFYRAIAEMRDCR